MKFRQKLAYMGIGFLFASLGYLLATLTADLKAEGEGKISHFEAITCETLAIVDEEGSIVAGLVADNLGGKLLVSDKDGKSKVELGINIHGAHMGITNSDGKPIAVVGTTSAGEGLIWTTDESGMLAIWSSSPSKLRDEMIRQHHGAGKE